MRNLIPCWLKHKYVWTKVGDAVDADFGTPITIMEGTCVKCGWTKRKLG